MEETFESGGYKLEDRGARWIEAYVRLKPGVTRQQRSRKFPQLPNDWKRTTRIPTVAEASCSGVMANAFQHAGTLLPTLEIMLAVVVFVLLIACANVGNLLLVKSFAGGMR